MKVAYLVILLTSLAFSNQSSASVIHSVDMTQMGGRNQLFDRQLFKLNVGGSAINSGNIAEYEYTVDDIGNSIIFDSGDAFQQAAELLTDGIDSDLGLFLSSPSGSGSGFTTTEFQFLFDGEGDRVDLSGYGITAFEIVIVSATFDSPGNDPNGDGIWTDYFLATTLNINGFSAIPLPPAYILFLSAFGIGALVRRKKSTLQGSNHCN